MFLLLLHGRRHPVQNRNAVQLENVILSRGFTSDPAKISLVWTSTGEAIGGLTC
jgi:hypothetical protein